MTGSIFKRKSSRDWGHGMNDEEKFVNVRGINVSEAVLPHRISDKTLPEAGRLVTALRQIGYSLEQALADLIDNSINAGATTVLIRFLHDGENVRSVAIVDDGLGMSSAELNEAMRFGTLQKQDPLSLGKFGMGLKLSSLSHARSLTVYSRKNGRSSARRWTVDSIKRGWLCERIAAPVPARIMNSRWATLDLSDSGSVVLWEDIDKLPSHRSGLRATLALLERRLRLHLGLCFHRFMESQDFTILIDQGLIDRPTQGLSARLQPLDPFDYPESGCYEYPKTFRCKVAGVGVLKICGHIWPAKSDAPEYRLGRRASTRQGFYFYRNDRLIQAGGWNGLVQDDTEPHSSLARVEVHLPPKFDHVFGINVQKSTVIVPPGFVEAVQSAVASDGTTFEEYRREAQLVYRSANGGERGFIAVPTGGVRKQLTQRFQEQLNGTKKTLSPVSFRWVQLNREEFFRVDKENAEIHLNADYRSAILGDRRGSGVDAPVLKLLLFFLMKRDFEYPSVSAQRQREVRQLNALLAEAAELI